MVRTSRGGLGQEAEAKERIEARLKTTSEAECNRMAQTFRDAKRSEALVRQAWSDLGKSQRACHQLDLAQVPVSHHSPPLVSVKGIPKAVADVS